jgi:hypothetical protein
MVGKLILVIFVFVFAVVIGYVFWNQPPSTAQIQSGLNTITQSFPTNDKVIWYLPAQPLTTLANTLSKNPVIPYQFSNLLLLGNDSHGDMIIQNGTKIVNSSTLSQNTTAYLEAHPELLQNMSQISTSGISYGSNTAGTASLTPTVTPTTQLGNIVKISGKLEIVDPNSCQTVTQNGQTTVQCNPIPGPYKYTLSIQCVDTNEWRCDWLDNGNMPTTHGTTNPDGTFEYDWTPLSPDPYYVGNYNAQIYFESATINPETNAPYSQTGNYPFAIAQ